MRVTCSHKWLQVCMWGEAHRRPTRYESNSRIVEWEDGTKTLFVGAEAFDITEIDDRIVLFEENSQELSRGEAHSSPPHTHRAPPVRRHVFLGLSASFGVAL